jgi:riboflavin biosynthesis pyrimidine reductase
VEITDERLNVEYYFDSANDQTLAYKSDCFVLAIEVLTEQASKSYLAFLQSMEIPYIICGTENLDLNQALTKLKKHFGITAISLAGGAIINGAFLKAHLVDEISLVVSPYVSGDQNIKSAFDTLGIFVDDKFTIKTTKPLGDGGVHLLYVKD